MLDRSPEAVLNGLFRAISTFTPEEREKYAREVANDPVRLKIIKDMLAMGEVMAITPTGYDTMIHECLQFDDPIPLDQITSPTLIVHGDKDGDVGFKENAM